MPSETDPLLPNNEPAPEIVGLGCSRKQKSGYDDQSPYQYSSHVAGSTDPDQYKESDTGAGNDVSPLRTILTIFTTVVGFGFILSILIAGEFGKRARAPQIVPSRPSTSIPDRVERILSEHPLIGCPFFEYMYSSIT